MTKANELEQGDKIRYTTKKGRTKEFEIVGRKSDATFIVPIVNGERQGKTFKIKDSTLDEQGFVLLHKVSELDKSDNIAETEFKKEFHKTALGKVRQNNSLVISKTPNVLVACGANANLDFTVSQSVIQKCLRPEMRDTDGKLIGKTGHGLTENQLYNALMNVKNPIMVLKGNRENSLVAVTDLEDNQNRQMIVSVILDKKSGRTEINDVTSVYGRMEFNSWLKKQVELNNVLAIDNKKAEPLLQPIGKKYPKRGEVISYDETIAYSFENVKYPVQKEDKPITEAEQNYNNILDNIKENPDVLKELLKTGSELYRYNFAEQLVIASANRDAKAVATYDQWNRIGCYVKRGSKSIPIPQKDGTVKHVFDISQVGMTKAAMPPVRWSSLDNVEDISNLLKNNYEFEKTGAYTLGDKVMALSEAFAEELSADVANTLQEDGRKEVLEKTLLSNMEKGMASIMAFSMMRRLGIGTDYYEKTGRINFAAFKDMPASVIGLCGESICNESGNVLHDIAIEVTKDRRERENTRINETSNEKNYLRISSMKKDKSGETVASQNEQIGTIMVHLLQDGNAPKEVQNAFQVIFNYLDDDAKKRISAIKNMPGSSDIAQKEIKKALPVLDDSSEGISVETSDMTMDVTWKDIDTVVNSEIEKGAFGEKIKSQPLFERWGLQLPELTNNSDFNNTVNQNSNIVNIDLEKANLEEPIIEKTAEIIEVDLNNKTAKEIPLSNTEIDTKVELLSSQDKEKSQELLGVSRLQLPGSENNLSSDITLHQSNNIVNSKSENEVSQHETQEKDIIKARDLKVGDTIRFNETNYTVMKIGIPGLRLRDEEGKEHTRPAFNLDKIGFEKISDGSEIIQTESAEVSHVEMQEIKSIDLSNVLKDENEVSHVETESFKITDEKLGEGTPREKFKRNIEAIRLLKDIENSLREATPEEKEKLSQYVGWGGLSDVFDERKDNWETERNQLKELLTDSEYAAARHSTLDSFYTSPVIIDAIYEKLSLMGLSEGKMLEPSCGVGNFIGRMPEHLSKVKVSGVELDSITGRLAKQIYSNADIQVKGFQDTSFANNTFDVAVGNVPFGELKVNDRDYNKDKLLIHDYFFSKTLDKLKPNGVLAFITSKGTLDKKDSHAREILSKKAEFLGAVRLPNTAFKRNAGTEVTSDIIFLKKKDVPTQEIDDSWVKTGRNENGIEMNQYFVDHPEMICGTMEMVSGRFGYESACKEDESKSLSEQLKEALSHIEGKIDYIPEVQAETKDKDIIIDTEAKNYSFIIKNKKVYFKEAADECQLATDKNDLPLKDKTIERIKGMCELRDKTYNLLNLQLDENVPDESIKQAQDDLLNTYNHFAEKNGRLNDRGNSIAFRNDDSYYLLTSLEKTDDDGNFTGLADIFYKRTVEPIHEISHCDTPHDALIVSLNKTAEVDIPYMAKLCDMTEDEVTATLINKEIFLNPQNNRYETADEYLSGNVRQKLKAAEQAAESYPELFTGNVEELKRNQPIDLEADEISVRLGSTWIPSKYIEDFAADVLKIPKRLFQKNTWTGKAMIQVDYDKNTSEWHVEGKHSYQSEQITNVYGYSSSRNALDILEAALNLRPVRIYQKDEQGNSFVDENATREAMAKQDALKDAFNEWIFDEPERRETLVKKYNEQFNSIKPREYDGSQLSLNKMNPSITLKKHQKDAVARQVYGGNSLLAHCVGAGKTFTMAAAGMELKNLGLAKKSLYVVPKSLVPQWAKEFATLYPTAKVLAAKQDDFSPSNRKKMTAKIATGEYDAIIISHGQFAKIPLSNEYQVACKQRELDEVMQFLAENADERGKSFSVKNAEKARERIEQEIDELNDIKQDNVITFEQLGVDHIFVDESHKYKNLPFHTKMQVAGINQSDTKSCKDMLYKCQYMNEKTNGKGVTFATGTPVSNSMTELYANMKYLQPDLLESLGCTHFDQWAANFGSTVTAMEFDVTGQRFRSKERFAEFFNLPELMSSFKEAADVRTVDMLPDINLPEHETHVVSVEASDFQKNFVEAIADRCDKIKSGGLDPRIDNMLKVTTDGRKVAFDQRMIDPYAPENPNSKINKCVEIAMDIYEKGMSEKATQIIFADMGVPNKEGNFDAYNDIKSKLMSKGVPEKEIALIHDYDTDTKKVALQGKMKKGDIRFLIGSTEKCGTGMNVQNKLKAAHHLDVPWRPSDIEQREGRILRQGNENKNVDIFRYVTQGTFDTYSWQIIEQKQKFVSQIMTSKSPIRAMSDVDGAVLEAATAKAIACGNTKIIDKANIEKDVAKLSIAKATFTKARYALQDAVRIKLPKEIETAKTNLINNLADARMLKANDFDSTDKDKFKIVINGQEYTNKKEGGEALIEFARNHSAEQTNGVECGEFKGFVIKARYDFFWKKTDIVLQGKSNHITDLSSDGDGQILRLDNALKKIAVEVIPRLETKISDLDQQLIDATKELKKPFPKEAELREKEAALKQINEELLADMGNSSPAEQVSVPEPEVIAVNSSREVSFKNLSIIEAEDGKFSLMGDVKRPNGAFENIMLTTGADKEDLVKWAENKGFDIKDISETIKGKITHQQNTIKMKEQSTPLKSGQDIDM